jgi:hypothetical protein
MMFASAALAQPAPPADPPASLAELPFWPVGFRLPESMGGAKPGKGPVGADVMVWVPEGAKQIRAMFIIPNNSDSKHVGEHPLVRQVAAKREMAIVYLRSFNTGIEHRPTAPEKDCIAELLPLLVEKTGLAEFRHAPWITLGKSSRGEFPFRMAWLYPDRTIASISYHGETPTWPVPEWAKIKGQSILELNANGETEWGGTWYVHVRPSLLNYRAKTGWLPHQIIARGVGHGDYADGHGNPDMNKPVPPGVTSRLLVWDYIGLFIDKALQLRVPTDKYPTDGPLQLKQVDEESGYLVDPFAVEEMFRVPHLPLREGPNGYVVGGADEPPVSGYAALSPLKDFAAAEGVPVVKYESGQSPREWLLSDSLKFAMQADPMIDLGPLAKLMPKPGDEVTIDGKTISFKPIIPKYVGKNGGVALNTGLRPSNAKITLLAYTVLELAQKQNVKVNAGFTAATRIQMVINGVPVKHKQVLELQPGRYPLLVVLRMTANWDRIEPSLSDAPDAEVAQARAMQVEAEKRAAEEAKLRAANPPSPDTLIRKATDVPKEQRAKMFWIADRELADAWIKLHSVAADKATPAAP